jgi:hypothetical protein
MKSRNTRPNRRNRRKSRKVFQRGGEVGIHNVFEGSPLEQKVKRQAFGGWYPGQIGAIHRLHDIGYMMSFEDLYALSRDGILHWYFQYAKLIEQVGSEQGAAVKVENMMNRAMNEMPPLDAGEREYLNRLCENPILQCVGATFNRTKNLLEKIEEINNDAVFLNISLLHQECQKILWYVARNKQLPPNLQNTIILQNFAHTPINVERFHNDFIEYGEFIEQSLEGNSFLGVERNNKNAINIQPNNNEVNIPQNDEQNIQPNIVKRNKINEQPNIVNTMT